VRCVLLQAGVGSLSYLITWQGSQPRLPPALFVSHFDVVPVPEDSYKVRTRHADTQETYLYETTILCRMPAVLLCHKQVDRNSLLSADASQPRGRLAIGKAAAYLCNAQPIAC
jgi:hypothetical protein